MDSFIADHILTPDVYFWVRIVTWVANFCSFCILAYKYVWNNFVGKDVHELNWGAVGVWGGTLAYGVSVGEILFHHDSDGGIRVFVSSAVAWLWLFIAIYKVPVVELVKDDDIEL